jgi:hypothetical protein
MTEVLERTITGTKPKASFGNIFRSRPACPERQVQLTNFNALRF